MRVALHVPLALGWTPVTIALRLAARPMRAAIQSGAPVQLMFLDIQMPEVDGFAVLSALVRERPPVPMPEVVFVTAYDEYALRAFDAHAAAYLLNPSATRSSRPRWITHCATSAPDTPRR